MKITTLIENVVYDQGLTGEHGLSLYLESGDKKILFDTGQTGNFIDNSVNLGVDIGAVTDLVISHGHYDHTGGIVEFIRHNKQAIIHIKKEAFDKKYRSNKTDFIGIPFEVGLVKERLNFIDKITEIATGLFVMPDIVITESDDLHYDGMFIKTENEFEPDRFNDELFLTVVHDSKISIISGCSHNGITNICNTAKNNFNLPFSHIIGGFHLKKSGEEQLSLINDYFRMIDPVKIGVCHCTGIEKYGILKSVLGKKVFYNYTGKTIII